MSIFHCTAFITNFFPHINYNNLFWIQFYCPEASHFHTKRKIKSHFKATIDMMNKKTKIKSEQRKIFCINIHILTPLKVTTWLAATVYDDV